MKKKRFYLQSYQEDWVITKGFPLAAKGLFWEMERWAFAGKPFGHITWPNGEVMSVASMATATGETPELIAEHIRLMERVNAIGLSKCDAYVMHHLVSREEMSKKRAKSGKNGASVTNGKERKKNSLPQQVPRQEPQHKESIVYSSIDSKKKERALQEYWWQGDVIKLAERDYKSMLEAYGGTDDQFMAWLQSRDQWFHDSATPEAKKNWFISTKRAIANIAVQNA